LIRARLSGSFAAQG